MTTMPISRHGLRATMRRGGVTAGEQRWLLWPPLVFFGVALGAPLVMMVIISLRGGGAAWGETLTAQTFLTAALRTFTMALIVTAISVVLGGIYALGIWVAPRWLSGVFVALLLLSMWTSALVRSMSWMLIEIPRGGLFWFLHLLGLTNQPVELYQTALAMYPAMVAIMLPYVVLPVTTALGGIDREQLSAATTFGAGPTLVFRTVVYPQIVPQLISGAVLVFVMALGFYVTPLMLGGPFHLTVTGVIDSELSKVDRPDIGSVESLLLIAATVVVYLIADRLFRVSERWG